MKTRPAVSRLGQLDGRQCFANCRDGFGHSFAALLSRSWAGKFCPTGFEVQAGAWQHGNILVAVATIVPKSTIAFSGWVAER